MLVECFMILLACCVGTAIIVPTAVMFVKWKKEMDAEWKE